MKTELDRSGAARPGPRTLEQLLGPEYSSDALSDLDAATLEHEVERLEHTWRRWVAHEHGQRGPEPGAPDRNTLERALPLLRVLVEAKQAIERGEDVVAGQARQRVQARGQRTLPGNSAWGLFFNRPTELPRGVGLTFPLEPADLETAHALVERQYRQLGYLSEGETHRWDDAAVPLVATHEGKVASTLALIGDTGRLPVDEVFSDITGPLRESGQRIVEVGSFASSQELPRAVQTRCTMTLVDLAHEAVRRNRAFDVALIAVHPHHAGFYAKRLGADLIVSEPRPHPKVQDAPAVLLAMRPGPSGRRTSHELGFVAKLVAATLEGLADNAGPRASEE